MELLIGIIKGVAFVSAILGVLILLSIRAGNKAEKRRLEEQPRVDANEKWGACQLEKLTRDMSQRRCTIGGGKSCVATCTHYEEGKMRANARTFKITPPSCKLWTVQSKEQSSWDID